MNLKEFMIKKGIFILGISLLILIGGGFFYYWQFYETPPEKWDEAKYSKPEDYEVIETTEGLIVENKKAGLSFKVPEGWRVEKGKYNEKQIFLYSPTAIEKNIYILESGCRIFPTILYITADIETIKKELANSMWGSSITSIEIISVDTHKALKYIAESSELGFYRIGVSLPVKGIIPIKNKVYSFGFDSALKEKEKCIQEFDQFLKTVTIK